MDTDDTLEVERGPVGDGTAVSVTVDRRAKRNALPLATIESLIETLDGIDTAADAVVLRGSQNFCAGVDLADVSDVDDLVEAGGLMHDVVETMRACPVPIVAAVRGYAFGAGFILCLGADVVVAAETASFGLQEVNLDVPVAGYVTTLLPRTVGDHRARDWLLSGREVPAAEAERAGLVARCVSESDLDDAVAETVARFDSSGDSAVRLLKERLAGPTDRADAGERDRLAARELADMHTAAAEGDVDAALSAYGADQ